MIGRLLRVTSLSISAVRSSSGASFIGERGALPCHIAARLQRRSKSESNEALGFSEATSGRSPLFERLPWPLIVFWITHRWTNPAKRQHFRPLGGHRKNEGN